MNLLCRICISCDPRKDISELQDEESIGNERKQSYEIMEFCLGIQVTQDNNITKKLCENCFNKIVEFYHFKSIALINDKHLRSIDVTTALVSNDNIKREPCSDGEVKKDHDYKFDYGELLIEVKEENNEDSDNVHLLEIDAASDDKIPLAYEENDKNVRKSEKDVASEDIKPFYKVEFLDEGIMLEDEHQIKLETKTEEKDVFKEKKKKVAKRKKVMNKKRQMEIKKPKCNICNICGIKVNKLKRHLLTHNRVKKVYICDLCGMNINDKPSLNRHITRVHMDYKKQCKICGKMFKNLTSHMQSMHFNKGSRQFECETCGSRFGSNQRLKIHSIIHSTERPYKCDVDGCNASFKRRLQVVGHKRAVHNKEKPYLCQICSQGFFCRTALNRHVSAVHYKEKIYKCADCDKAYTRSETLRNHIRSVHGNDIFNCSKCDMTFASMIFLKRHMETHDKVKKYPCHYCDMKFHRSDTRLTHERNIHLKCIIKPIPITVDFTPPC